MSGVCLGVDAKLQTGYISYQTELNCISEVEYQNVLTKKELF